MKTAMVEAEMVMGGVVSDLLEKTGECARRVGSRGCSVWGAHARVQPGGTACAMRQRALLCPQQRLGTLMPLAFPTRLRAHHLCCRVLWYGARTFTQHAGVKPEEVDILITNCSIFCPTPSLASMLINKFKFRRDIQAYNLGGMGCSIGVIAVGLVRDMLQVCTHC